MRSSAARRRGPPPAERTASAVSAMMPPSPLLSARRISSTYFSVTTSISIQKIVETAPTRCGPSSGTPTPGLKISFIV